MCVPSDFQILVVDDIDDNIFFLQTILETEGYQVETATDGGTALTKVKDFLPDLILMDIMMPGMNGYEVTRKIRQNPDLPFIPILMVTAHDNIHTDQQLALEPGNFIRKPVECDQLLSKVATLLEAKADHRD
ncbi:response regulator [Nodosilinea sp. P-1105]|uniref:response regulator n=1 Tax=Nodosilinea sp. P-1105 TaxID=2546229 RepID=UPI00146BC3E0|nr:response regulator [Nodosilinea sp. P-1105]